MVQIGPDRTLSIADLHAVTVGTPVEVTPEAYRRIDEACAFVQRIVAEKRIVYGITTGFGPLAGTYVDPARSEELQRHLLSHLRTGVGPELAREQVRALMAARLSSIVRGHSGVGRGVVDLLAGMINADVVPVVPAMGTVGASGDLTPLAHMAAALQGEGTVLVDRVRMSAIDGLKRTGLTPITFGPKEAIALTNGTSAMTGIAALNGHFFAKQLELAVETALLYAEVMNGKAEAFDPRVGQVRPHPGQQRVHAALQRAIATGTRVSSDSSTTQSMSPGNDGNSEVPGDGVLSGQKIVQDPYSIRCIPQHYGACFDVLDFHNTVVERELNSVTDNPLLFPEEDTAIQGGNFYGQHVAFVSDALVNAVIAAAVHIERSIDRVTDPVRSRGLPPMLQPRFPGLQSGFMGAQVTATAIVAEMRTRATPASIQSITTNAANQDIVTMGTIGARNAAWQIEQLWNLLAIQALVLAQAAELRVAEASDARETLQSVGFAESSRNLIDLVREQSPHLEDDRPLSDEIAAMADALRYHLCGVA